MKLPKPKRTLTTNDLISRYRAIFTEFIPAWVMFKNGTAVTLRELPDPPTTDNINNYAVDLLENYGKAYPGSASADFRVVPGKHPETMKDSWLVRFWHKDITVYVDVEDEDQFNEMMVYPLNEMDIGFFGRDIREKDANQLEVVHTEIREKN